MSSGRPGRPAVLQQQILQRQDEIRQWILDGASLAEMARRLDCNEGSLSRLRGSKASIARIFEGVSQPARKHGRYESPAQIPAEGFAEIRRMREAGETHAAIAEWLQVSLPTLAKWRRRCAALELALEGNALPEGVPPEAATTRFGKLTDLNTLEQIREWCLHGLSDDSIAALLELSLEDWEQISAGVPAVREAVRFGRAQSEEAAAKKLFQAVSNPDDPHHMGAVKFLLTKRWAPSRKATSPRAPRVMAPPAQMSEAEILAALENDGGSDDD